MPPQKDQPTHTGSRTSASRIAGECIAGVLRPPVCGHLLQQPRETCTSPPGTPQWKATSPEFKPGMRALRNNRLVSLSITYPDKVTLGPKPGLSQDLDLGLPGTLRPWIPLPGDRSAEGSHGHMPRCPTLGLSGRRRRPPILLGPHCAAGWPLLPSQQWEPHPRLPLRESLQLPQGLSLQAGTLSCRQCRQAEAPHPASVSSPFPRAPYGPTAAHTHLSSSSQLQAQPRLHPSLCAHLSPFQPLPSWQAPHCLIKGPQVHQDSGPGAA